MKKLLLHVLLCCAVIVSCLSPSAHRSITKKNPPNKQQLFDGTSFAGWRPLDMKYLGDISIQDSLILLGRGGYFTGITWTGPLLTMNYELSLDAKRVEGLDFFCGLTFPFEKTFASLIIGGWGGYTTGISSINGIDASENGTSDVVMFEENVWYHIRLRVTPHRIQAWVDYRNIVDLDTAGKRIALRSDAEVTAPLSIMTYNTTGAVKNIRMMKIGNDLNVDKNN